MNPMVTSSAVKYYLLLLFYLLLANLSSQFKFFFQCCRFYECAVMFHIVNSVLIYSAVKYFLSYPFSRTVALGSTQPLTEMSTRNLPGVKSGRPARKAENITVICETIF
jgi:hypothetical protein